MTLWQALLFAAAALGSLILAVAARTWQGMLAWFVVALLIIAYALPTFVAAFR